MQYNYILYTSIWCPIEDARACIGKGRPLMKEVIELSGDYCGNEGFIFLELTEDALRNLPQHMVGNMKCFSRENIDTMVYCTKVFKCSENHVEMLKAQLEDFLDKISVLGFKSEMVIICEKKIEEENSGKTVGRKDYEILSHRQF
jgi:hypothetical protein